MKILKWLTERFLEVQSISTILGLANFFMIFSLYSQRYDFVVLPAVLGIVTLGGYVLDKRLHFRELTQKSHGDQNPYFKEILKKLEKLEARG